MQTPNLTLAVKVESMAFIDAQAKPYRANLISIKSPHEPHSDIAERR